jgi:hypothetical protein
VGPEATTRPVLDGFKNRHPEFLPRRNVFDKVGAMPETLPQQRLLLELLIMSGQIAVTSDAEDTILWRTVTECKTNRWITWIEVSPGIFQIEITRAGRAAAVA